MSVRRYYTDTRLSVTIVGGVRLYFLYRNTYLPKSPDSHYNIGYITTCLETNLAVMAASGPALWPLARRWFPAFFQNLGLSRGYQGHIPDIETTTNHDLAKAETASSSRARVFRLLNHKKASTRISVGPSAPSRPSRLSEQMPGSVVPLDRNIGGNSFALKEVRGDRTRGRTEIRSHTPPESEEEIMTCNGIMRRTDYSVPRDDRSSGATDTSSFGQPPQGTGRRATVSSARSNTGHI